MVLWFRLLTRTVLINTTVLNLLLSSACTGSRPVSHSATPAEQAGVGQEGVRAHSQDSRPKQTEEIFHTI